MMDLFIDETEQELHLACMNGNVNVVKKLINQGCDLDDPLNFGKRKGYSALHLAAEFEKTEVIKILLDKGANIYLQNESGSTPLHAAYENKSILGTLLILLKVNASKDIVNNSGLSHFHIACSTDEIDIVENFILKGAKLNNQVQNYSKYRGNTPLHFACYNSSAKTVKYLLEKGADFTLKNANNETPLHVALKTYCDKAVQLILKAYYKACSIINYNIKQIFTKSNIPTDIRVNFNQKFIEMFRPLHFAVEFQLIEIIKILIENGIDLEAKDSNGRTALHCAVQNTQTGLLEEDYLDVCLQNIHSVDESIISTFSIRLSKIINLLLNSGCKINAIDNFGRPPIFYLYDRLSQRAELKAPCLFRKSSKSNYFDSDSPIASARKNIIRVLYSYSPDLNVKDHAGNTILHLMAKAGNDLLKFEAQVAEEYLKKGGNVNALNHDGYTALHYTCGNGFTELMNLLLQYGADVNLTLSEKMERPIHKAVQFQRCSGGRIRSRNKFDIVEKLLKHGAYLDAKMTNGMTPILIATKTQYFTGTKNNLLIMCLVHWGCDLNCSDSLGRTPLHYICKHKNLGLLDVFLKHGADINALDHHGNTPFSIARKSNCFSLVDSLILFSYLKRLMILGVPLCYTNKRLYALHNNLVNLCDNIKQKLREILTEEECRAQIEFMKTVHVDSYTTLYDILHKSANNLVHHVNNDKLLNVFCDTYFDDDYSVYGYLVKIKIKNAKKRAILLKPAKESLITIFKLDMPDACFHGILAHLGNNDLKYLIEATSSNNNKEETEYKSTQDVKRLRLT